MGLGDHGVPHTMDGRNPAPPKELWNDDSPVNSNERYGFNRGNPKVRNGFRNHPQYDSEHVGFLSSRVPSGLHEGKMCGPFLGWE